MANTFMNVMKRSEIRNTSTTAEIITSYDWDFRFTKVPKYWGDTSDPVVGKYMDLFRCRTNSVTTPEEPTNTPVTVMVRGHQFSQPGMSTNYGQFGFTLQDFADTGIQKSLLALEYAMSLPENKAMLDDAYNFFFDCEFFQLNSERQLIKKWICKDCLLISANVVDTMDSSKTAIGQTSVVFSTDFYTVEYPSAPSDDINTSTNYISGYSSK